MIAVSFGMQGQIETAATESFSDTVSQKVG